MKVQRMRQASIPLLAILNPEQRMAVTDETAAEAATGNRTPGRPS